MTRQAYKLAEVIHVNLIKPGQSYSNITVKGDTNLVIDPLIKVELNRIGTITHISSAKNTGYDLLYLYIPKGFTKGIWVNETAFEVRDVPPELPAESEPVTNLIDLCKNKYDVVLHGKYDTGSIIADVYTVLNGFKVTIAQLQHSIKKELKVGQRGHKDIEQDLIDIRDSTQSALDAFYAKRKGEGK